MLTINVFPRLPKNRSGLTIRPPIWRFTQKYRPNPETGCWDWTAHVGRWGYGDFRRGAGLHNAPAHRWSFEYFVRPLLDGEQVHHKCENKRCVNPEHLEALTLDEHNLLHGKSWGLNKIKVECKRGHPLSGDNLGHYTPGQRACKKCNNIRAKEHRLRRQKGGDK